MTITMTFNGIDMSHFFRIVDIVRPIGNNRSVTTDDAPFIGANLQQVKIGAKVIKVKFVMQGRDIELLKHELAGVLHVSTPVKITFSDEGDKYYLGIPIDDLDMDNAARWFQKSEISFLIPDGVAHKKTKKVLTTPVTSGDKLVFNIVNGGNVPSYPLIELTNHAANGYFGLVNGSTAFELGKNGAETTVTTSQNTASKDYRGERMSRALFDGRKTNNPLVYTDSSPLYNEVINLELKRLDGRNYICCPDVRATHAAYQTKKAGSITLAAPTESRTGRATPVDSIQWNQVFYINRLNSSSDVPKDFFCQVSAMDAQERFLYGVQFYIKRYELKAGARFLVSDGRGRVIVNRKQEFEYHTTDKNPFFNNSRGGTVRLHRNQDSVTLSFGDFEFSAIVADIKTTVMEKVQLTMNSYDSIDLDINQGRHYGVMVGDLLIQKNVLETNQHSNQAYNPGDKILINSEEDTVTVNGISKPFEVAQGSQWLALPPGQSQLEIYVSSWCQTKPSAKVTFEERYL